MNLKHSIAVLALGLTVAGCNPSPAASNVFPAVTMRDIIPVVRVDDNTRIELWRIDHIEYDCTNKDYRAITCPLDTREDGSFAFSLDMQGAEYNELIEEGLNRTFQGNLVQLTIDDNGNGISDDDFVYRAIF